jgi:hypothetical protein
MMQQVVGQALPPASPAPRARFAGESASPTLLLLRVAAILAVCAVLWTFTPPELPVCGFRWLTGRPCPLCGLTHAIFALAKGRVGEAIRLHPLSPLAIVMLAGTSWSARRMARFWGPCLAAFGVYGLWRIAF